MKSLAGFARRYPTQTFSDYQRQRPQPGTELLLRPLTAGNWRSDETPARRRLSEFRLGRTAGSGSALEALLSRGGLSAFRLARRLAQAGSGIAGSTTAIDRGVLLDRRRSDQARQAERIIYGASGAEEESPGPGLRRIGRRRRGARATSEQETELTVREPGRPGRLPMPAELFEEITRPRSIPARLDYAIRMRLAPFLGFDPWIARLHSGPAAARAARALRAQAFAIGHDVFFAEGRFETRTSEGLALLAHELTHVGQQARARSSELRFFTPEGGDVMEAEAQQVASRVQSQDRRGHRGIGPRHEGQEDLLHSEAHPPKPSMSFAMPAPAPGAESTPEPSKTATHEREAKGKGGKQGPSSRGSDANAVAERVYDLMREEIRLGRQRGAARFAT